MALGKYKDVLYSKNSELAEAIEAGDELRAKRTYLECEVEFQKHVQGTEWAKPIERVQRELDDTIAKIEKIRYEKERAEMEAAQAAEKKAKKKQK